MIQGNYEAKLKAHGAAVRKRLMRPPNSIASIAERKRGRYIDMYRSLPTSKTGVLVQDVAFQYGVSVDEMKSASRFKSIVAARDCAIRRLRDRGLSLSQIGDIFNRDHTSILRRLKRMA